MLEFYKGFLQGSQESRLAYSCNDLYKYWNHIMYDCFGRYFCVYHWLDTCKFTKSCDVDFEI